MKSIAELTYTEMVEKIAETKRIIAKTESAVFKRQLYKYLKRLQKEILIYKQIRSENYGKRI